MHALTGWFIRNPGRRQPDDGPDPVPRGADAARSASKASRAVPPESVIIAIEFPDATGRAGGRTGDQKIEQALEGLEGVRSVTSQSQTGPQVVTVRRAGGEDLQAVLDRVRIRIDGFDRTCPAETARRPVIEAVGL